MIHGLPFLCIFFRKCLPQTEFVRKIPLGRGVCFGRLHLFHGKSIIFVPEKFITPYLFMVVRFQFLESPEVFLFRWICHSTFRQAKENSRHQRYEPFLSPPVRMQCIFLSGFYVSDTNDEFKDFKPKKLMTNRRCEELASNLYDPPKWNFPVPIISAFLRNIEIWTIPTAFASKS